MIKTLILFQSKYGFTQMIAENLALILGPAKCCRVNHLQENCDDFEVVVFCTPIYLEQVDPDILKYVAAHAEWIRRKKVFLICSCLEENKGDEYLQPLKAILGDSVQLQKTIGGYLAIEKLISSDYKLMKNFCGKINLPLKDANFFQKEKLVETALEIKKIRDQNCHLISESLLFRYINEFLQSHNTCTLATGHDEIVRATPIEYTWMNSSLYILSEGGEKFAHLLINPRVSICVYDAYRNMNELGGLQITGIAEIIKLGSDEYQAVLVDKGLKFDKIKSLPMALNLIKIRIQKIEFLWSEFTRLGYDVKQTLTF